jgi:energy-coupling factor transporter ATP-binding protein EcfA2
MPNLRLSEQSMNSFFTSINANKLTASDVGETFVPSSVFWALLHKENSVVVGPRGSGKTTLLKMLQPAALSTWAHPLGEQARQSIGFCGVFVPADRLWHEDFLAATKDLPPDWAQRFGAANFSLQTLAAVVRAAADALERQTDEVPHERERRAVESIARASAIDVQYPTLRGLSVALDEQRAWLGRMSTRVGFLGSQDEEAKLAVRDARLDVSVLEVLPLVATALSEAGLQVTTWGLLFDELEIAPSGTVKTLFAALRGFDGRYVFKLALNPNTPELRGVQSLIDAQTRQDFQIHSLMFGHKEAGYEFSESLVRSLLIRSGIELSPEEIFLRSTSENEGGKNAYGANSENVKLLKRLALIDGSFRHFLSNNKINLDRIDSLKDSRRAEVVRKSIRIVRVRSEYLHKTGMRSYDLYSGLPELYAICEGNPRWMIGLIQRMLDRVLVSAGSDGEVAARVPRSVQSDEIRKAISEYRAFLRSVPVPSGADWGTRGLVGLVDKIGKFFSSSVLGDEFNDEPPLSFIVDSNADDSLLEILGTAVSVGAIIPVEEPSRGSIVGAASGGRYRLTYLLSPTFGLPTILGRGVSLSSVLGKSASTRVASLFDSEETDG